MNKIIIYIEKFLIWALPAVSLVALSNTFFPFITGKAFLFRIAVELILFLYVVLAVSNKAYRPKWDLISIVFAIFTLVILIADISAINPSKAIWSNFERMEGFVTIAHLFVYFMVARSIISTRQDWRIWKLSGVAISVYMILFCLLQLSGGVVINQGGVRVDGSLGNAAYLGTYLLFVFFFLVYLWTSDKVSFREISLPFAIGGLGYSLYYLVKISQAGSTYTNYGLIIFISALLLAIFALISRSSRNFVDKYGNLSAHILYLVIAISYLFVLYHTATRGATLGLIGGVFVATLYLLVKEKKDIFSRKVGAGALILICLFVVGFYFARNMPFVQNSPVLSRFASISLDTKGQARNYVWPMAISGFKERPILGWGQEGFNYVFQKYYVPEMITQEPYFDRAHNSFLDWLVAGGILGFIAYLSLYLITVIYVWKSVIFTDKEKAVLLGLVLAYAFQNIFIFDNLLSYILFVSFLAMVSVLHKQRHELENHKVNEEGGLPLLAVCLAGFVVVALLVNMKAYQQNVTIIKAISPQQKGISENLELFKKAIAYNSYGTYEAREQLTRIATEIVAATQVPDEVKIAFANLVNDEMDKQIEETPQDVRVYLGIGNFLVLVGAYDQAIPKLEKALTISPKKQQISFTLAQAYLGKADLTTDAKEKKNNIDEAVSYIKTVYDLSPDIDAVRVPYIRLLLISNQIKPAVDLIKEVKDPSYLMDALVLKALTNNNQTPLAESLLKKIIELDSKQANAYLMLADVYITLKDKARAIAVLEDLKKAIPDQTAEADKDIEAVKAHFK